MKRLPAVFPYVGGKWRMAPKIVALLPEHQVYVEVFGGSGAVLFAKERSHIEVFNDIDSEVVNFFEVIRQPATRQQLVEQLSWTPYSREIFAQTCRTPTGSSLDRAWRFFVQAQMCFGGHRPARSGEQAVTPGRWRHDKSSNGAGGAAGTFHRRTKDLRRIGDRLLQVFIERRDFPQLISTWDSPDTVFYLDPPYVGTEGYYDNGHFGSVRHHELADVLNGLQGKAIVSYYPHSTLDELYPADRWPRIHFETTRNHGSSSPKHRKPRSTEMLLLNFREDGSRLRGKRPAFFQGVGATPELRASVVQRNKSER